jgi:hypothetical protein
VSQPTFLETLEAARRVGYRAQLLSLVQLAGILLHPRSVLERPDGPFYLRTAAAQDDWSGAQTVRRPGRHGHGTGDNADVAEGQAPPLESGGDVFEVVQRQDAVDAMAFYIAQCLAQHPEARGLTPKQIQDALAVTLKVRPLA